MFGWPQQAAVVASVYDTLRPEDRAALRDPGGELRGSGRYRLFRGGLRSAARAISGHNNYYLWGPRGYSGDVVITVGMRREDLQSLFGAVEQVATINDPYAVPDENNLPVYLCRLPAECRYRRRGRG